jgi:dipeptidyl aminopeptidase/acylaminoacyl peptidase
MSSLVTDGTPVLSNRPASLQGRMLMSVVRTTLVLMLSAVTVGTAGAQDEPGYPIRDFLGLTIFTELAVSPDGRHVAFVTLADDFERNHPEMAIWRIDLDSRGRKIDALRLTATPGAYSGIRWSPEGCYLAFLSTRPPATTQQLLVLDMRGGEPLALTDPDTYSDGISAYDWLPDGNGIVFAALDPPSDEEREKAKAFYGDVVRIAEETPSTSFWQIATSEFNRPSAKRIATVATRVIEVRVSPDGRQLAYLSGPPTKPEVFTKSFSQTEVFLLPADGGEAPRQLTHNYIAEQGLQWTRDGGGLYTGGNGDPGATRTQWTQGRLFHIDLQTGQAEIVVPGFPGELNAPFGSSAYVQLPDGSLLSGATVSTRTNIYAVDPAAGRARRLTDFRGAATSPSASRDGRLIAFILATAESFPELYVARGISSLANAQAVTDFNAELDAMPMPETETIRWPNGEGDEIEGVLYWPPGRRGEANLPLIVDIHGGPWWAKTEDITFNAPFVFAYYPALLASRGYLVLEPNYRGGTGRGDAFLHAIEGYSCSRPATDVLTGVDYLIQQGWADPDRMGVMGYSYGGLMTNCLITKTDRFRAAASGAGLWNDISYFGTADNFIQNDVRNLGEAPWENLQNYWEESAIGGAGNITTPTLIVIGGADRRVPTTQGYELYRALVRLGVPAELLIFPGEDHGFVQPAHKLTKVRAEIRWLEHYVLGKGMTLE